MVVPYKLQVHISLTCYGEMSYVCLQHSGTCTYNVGMYACSFMFALADWVPFSSVQNKIKKGGSQVHLFFLVSKTLAP